MHLKIQETAVGTDGRPPVMSKLFSWRYFPWDVQMLITGFLISVYSFTVPWLGKYSFLWVLVCLDVCFLSLELICQHFPKGKIFATLAPSTKLLGVNNICLGSSGWAGAQGRNVPWHCCAKTSLPINTTYLINISQLTLPWTGIELAVVRQAPFGWDTLQRMPNTYIVRMYKSFLSLFLWNFKCPFGFLLGLSWPLVGR